MENKESYVPVEMAELLKKIGFNEQCSAVYFNRELLDIFNVKDIDIDKTISAPTISHVLKWLRDKNNIIIIPGVTKENSSIKWYYQIVDNVYSDSIYYRVSKKSFTTYEKALISGISEVLNEIKLV